MRDFGENRGASPLLHCLPALPNERQDEIPDLIFRLLRHRSFRTIKQRMGR